MRYSTGLSGLLTVALSATGFAQTPEPSTTDVTSTGGMNVPTSVTRMTDFTTDLPTNTMTTMVKPTLTPPGTCECGTGSCFTPEICCLECTTVYEECCSIEGADIEICKKQYTICLGYNPYDSVFVKPSTCKHDKSYYIEYESKYSESYFVEKYGYYYSESYSVSSSSSSSSYSYHEGYYTAEYCCVECTTVYDECCAVPGADLTVCKEKYTVCLGYNPFIIVPWEKPAVCKHEESYYGEWESKHGESGYKSEYEELCDYSSNTNVDLEQCCVECTTVYDECCAVAGSDIEICKKEYTICLGYNPWDVTPYVKPTVCKVTGSSSSSSSSSSKSDEECCVECTTVYDECCKVPGADIEICKKEYVVCIGYNPWDVTPFVKPTVCKHSEGSSSSSSYTKTTGSSSSSSSSEEECCVQCTTVYDECCSTDGHDIETCKKEYVVCLGYNPWDVTPFVKPTVCKHGDNNRSSSNNNGGKTDNNGGSSNNNGGSSSNNGGKTDNNGGSSKSTGGSSSSSSSKSDEECCVECTTTYKACCDASGAIIETCKTAYTTCLGYNPWDVTPFVEPTVCKHGGNKDDVVIVSGGERVRPVLALLAIGAVALLCK
ncbi:hypothetical protein F53441_1982 [Fusarium austroafricanum]|uniref:Uncharacterized protein n=1 Tax=Fusarium austroafricanum TaxID=2364996 RepID=A0A8H4KU77_9HYPO|nr:hypothetical protein F53441_1982 [Fusarium austroafricanum]